MDIGDHINVHTHIQIFDISPLGLTFCILDIYSFYHTSASYCGSLNFIVTETLGKFTKFKIYKVL